MDALWHSKGNVTDPKTKADWGTSFNGQKLVLTEQDIDALELAIKERELPQTGGFFFGSDSYEYIGDDGNYEDYSKDIKFLEDARTALKEGKTVYYQCSW
jgi:hypothetical protein